MGDLTALLRLLLYLTKSTDDIQEIRRAIEVMCSEEDIAVVEKKIADRKK